MFACLRSYPVEISLTDVAFDGTSCTALSLDLFASNPADWFWIAFVSRTSSSLLLMDILSTV